MRGDVHICFYSTREVLAATLDPVQPPTAAVCALRACNSILRSFRDGFSVKQLPELSGNASKTQNTRTRVRDGGPNRFCSAREVPSDTLEHATPSQTAASDPWPCTSKEQLLELPPRSSWRRNVHKYQDSENQNVGCMR